MNKCAYLRVSTEKEEQDQSLNSQEKYYKNQGITDIFWDKESATSVNREGFKDMLLKCGVEIRKLKTGDNYKYVAVQNDKTSEYEYIYCKSISRFSRDLSGAIEVIRELKNKGVYCIFEQENINTQESTSDFLMSLMLSLSQQESTTLSERVRWGAKRTAEEGKCRSHNLYGYNYNKLDSSLSINKDEVDVVRRIYDLRLQGLGYRRIANELTSIGVKTRSGVDFGASSIKSILINKTYCGYARRNTVVSEGFGDSKRRKIVHKENVLYVKSDKIEPIIKEEIFDKVQELINENLDRANNKGKYNGKDMLNNKIKCECGRSYTKIVNTYICSRKKNYGKKACQSQNINVKLLDEIIDLYSTKSYYKNTSEILLNNLIIKVNEETMKMVSEYNNSNKGVKIEENKKLITKHKDNIDKLLTLMLSSSAQEIVEDKIKSINNEIEQLEQENKDLSAPAEKLMEKMDNIDNLFKEAKKYVSNIKEEITREEFINNELVAIHYKDSKLIFITKAMLYINNFNKIVQK